MSEPLLTRCVCIDPRRINPATGHYPGCPDEIIPPGQLLPPHELVTRVENTLEGRGPRSEKYPEGKPIFGKIVHADLVPGRAWTAPVKPVRAAEVSAATAEQPAAAAPVESDPPDSIIVVLDTETTGLRRTGAVVGVCEIGLSVIDLSPEHPVVIAQAARLLYPGCKIPRESSAVHGITDEMVAGKAHLSEVWGKLCEWVTKHAGHHPQIIAHNAPYDREVIADVLRAASLPLPPWHWRCSLSLAKRVIPGLPSYSLHDGYGKPGLATSLQLVKGEGHRAMGDVITTVSLLGALRARAGAWTSWRGDAVVWGAPANGKAVEAPKGAAKPVESAPEKPAPAPAPAPSPSPKTVKGRRPAPTGPDLFSRIAKESA